MNDRIALITGGSSGLGLATAERMSQDGLSVITVDLDPAADYQVDVSDSDAVIGLAEELGSVDVVVNSAGVVGPNRPLWEVDPGEWDRTFEVNVRGTFNMCRAFVPGMRDAG